MRLLCDDKALREKMGNNAFKWVRERFDLTQKTEQYLNIYTELLEKKFRVLSLSAGKVAGKKFDDA